MARRGWRVRERVAARRRVRAPHPAPHDRHSRRAEGAREANAEAPQLFLVSFFSYQPEVAFQPEDLQVTYQGRIMRAAAILPVTGGFGRQRLAQQVSQSAIYAFDERIDYAQPFVVRYGFDQSDEWLRILPKLEVERAKVRARG
jgi:hypothetical protein